MGYNTQVLILNDGLDQIEKHPEEFVKNLVRAIQMGSHGVGPSSDDINVSCGNHANVASVIPTQHADVTRVLVSNGNWMWEIPGRYGHSEHIMERAKTEKHIRDELMNRCRDAKETASATLARLQEMAREDRRGS